MHYWEVNRAGVSTYGTIVPEVSIALCIIWDYLTGLIKSYSVLAYKIHYPRSKDHCIVFTVCTIPIIILTIWINLRCYFYSYVKGLINIASSSWILSNRASPFPPKKWYKTRSNHRLYQVCSCKGVIFSIHPLTPCLDVKVWQKIGITFILSPTRENLVGLANQYASPRNGGRHWQNVYRKDSCISRTRV